MEYVLLPPNANLTRNGCHGLSPDSTVRVRSRATPSAIGGGVRKGYYAGGTAV